jgi:hypothetical protein
MASGAYRESHRRRHRRLVRRRLDGSCCCCSGIGCFVSKVVVGSRLDHRRLVSFFNPSPSPLSELNLLFKDTTFEHPIIFITFKFRLSNEL